MQQEGKEQQTQHATALKLLTDILNYDDKSPLGVAQQQSPVVGRKQLYKSQKLKDGVAVTCTT